MTKAVLLKKIGDQIVALRKKQNLTQSDLAHLTGKDRQNIRRLEKGLINPSIFHLSEIAAALKVTLSDLLKLD